MVKQAFLFVCWLMVIVSGACSEEWSEQQSDHFIVYSKNAPSGFVQNALESAEQIYEKTTTTLGITRYQGWIWEDRVKIYIYDNADDYKQSSGYDWSAGIVSTQNRTISTYPSASGFFDSVLPHELGHIIFREYVGSDADIPLWFEEGVAMYQERGKRFGADDDVRQIMKTGHFIPLSALHDMRLGKGSDPDLVKIFYAEAASVVSFLLEEGEQYRFSRLCDELKKEVRFETAFKKSYMAYQTLNDLDVAWRGYLEK
ncbi:MAG: hypothetical protein HQL21_05760 [Candidatus Omnitrophica bacterium]|nr:hypothetical protein [Candidatus Omnitrophota bacterium]